MIQMFIDSTCDMPKEWLEKYNIKVLPLIVNLDGRDYQDGIEIQLEDLYESMRAGIVPKTSQVPYETMHNAFTECLKAGDDLIYIAFSSKLSGTYDLAYMIIEELKTQFRERNIALIDSKGGSLATGLIVNETCKLIKSGCSSAEAVSYAKNLISRVEHLFTISNLDWLSKGGRISKPLGYIGDILHIKPILNVENGKMVVIKMIRGRKKALKELTQILTDRIKGLEDQMIGIAHAGDQDTALVLKTMIEEILPKSKVVICQIGCVLGVHLGIGGVGAFFFRVV